MKKLVTSVWNVRTHSICSTDNALKVHTSKIVKNTTTSNNLNVPNAKAIILNSILLILVKISWIMFLTVWNMMQKRIFAWPATNSITYTRASATIYSSLGKESIAKSEIQLKKDVWNVLSTTRWVPALVCATLNLIISIKIAKGDIIWNVISATKTLTLWKLEKTRTDALNKINYLKSANFLIKCAQGEMAMFVSSANPTW